MVQYPHGPRCLPSGKTVIQRRHSKAHRCASERPPAQPSTMSQCRAVSVVVDARSITRNNLAKMLHLCWEDLSHNPFASI